MIGPQQWRRRSTMGLNKVKARTEESVLNLNKEKRPRQRQELDSTLYSGTWHFSGSAYSLETLPLFVICILHIVYCGLCVCDALCNCKCTRVSIHRDADQCAKNVHSQNRKAAGSLLSISSEKIKKRKVAVWMCPAKTAVWMARFGTHVASYNLNNIAFDPASPQKRGPGFAEHTGTWIKTSCDLFNHPWSEREKLVLPVLCFALGPYGSTAIHSGTKGVISYKGTRGRVMVR